MPGVNKSGHAFSEHRGIAHCRNMLLRWDAATVEVPQLRRLFWSSDANLISMHQLLLSLPVDAWFSFFLRNRNSFDEDLASIYRQPVHHWPKMPTYSIASVPGSNVDVEVRMPGHIPNFALYDSYGIFNKAVDLPDGEVFDLENWKQERKRKGPEIYRFRAS